MQGTVKTNEDKSDCVTGKSVCVCECVYVWVCMGMCVCVWVKRQNMTI